VVLLACAYLLVLFAINAYVCRPMFDTATAHMNSMHGFWAALATRANGSWFHITWWPYWDNGIPFEAAYSPLVPGLAGLISSLHGVPAMIGFSGATALCYILGPCTLYLMAWRLTGAPGYSFLAALLYSLTSVSQFLAPDGAFAWKNFWDHRRLFIVAVWDDTPHLAALTCLPLVIFFLVRSIAAPQHEQETRGGHDHHDGAKSAGQRGKRDSQPRHRRNTQDAGFRAPAINSRSTKSALINVATSGCTCPIITSASSQEPSRKVVSRTKTVPRVARSRKSAISAVWARCRRMPPWPSIDAKNLALWSKQLRKTQSTPPHLEAIPLSASHDAMLLESCLSIIDTCPVCCRSDS
jgi:hypothetical protein